MWKKDELPGQMPQPQTEAVDRAPVKTVSDELATIGRSIRICGEVTGDEDLLIQGRVEGSVSLQQHSITVGPTGELEASISARTITIEGKVEGSVSAEEQVVLRSSAWVQGDIAAPRLVLEDGARFRGGVDMGDSAERGDRKEDVAIPSGKVRKRQQLEAQPPKLVEASGENGNGLSDAVPKVTT